MLTSLDREAEGRCVRGLGLHGGHRAVLPFQRQEDRLQVLHACMHPLEFITPPDKDTSPLRLTLDDIKARVDEVAEAGEVAAAERGPRLIVVCVAAAADTRQATACNSWQATAAPSTHRWRAQGAGS
jgi:hypothetical protein